MSVYLPGVDAEAVREAREEALQLTRRGFIKLTGVAGGGFVLALSFGPAAERAFAQG